jgi:hypothetical protein
MLLKFPKVLGVSNQFELPIGLKKNPFLASIYPKYIGFYTICEALYNQLLDKAVFNFNADVKSISYDEKFLVDLIIDQNTLIKNEYDYIIWTAPSLSLANILGLNIEKSILNTSKKSYIHIALSQPHNIHQAYYLYDYDINELNVFRLSFYNNYSTDASMLNKITIESWSDVPIDPLILKKYLIKNGIINNTTDIQISPESKFGHSFPLLTNDFIKNLTSINKQIKDAVHPNLIVNNAFFEDDEFFLHELLRNLDQRFTKVFCK